MREEALAEVAEWIVGERPLHDVLVRVAQILRDAVEVADEASVMLARGPHDLLYGGTSAVAETLDERQAELGRGPCLDAAYAGEAVLIPDMAAEDRWPAYAARAVEVGVLSSYAVPLAGQAHVLASIDLYAYTAHAFDEAAIASAEAAARKAASAIVNAHLYARAADLEEQMREALRSRAVIEQAKGILMGRHGVTPEAAFELLTRQSQHQNQKLRDVATELVRSVSRQSR